MERKVRSSVEQAARLAQFAYDRAQPLDVQEAGVEYRDLLAIHDVSYVSFASGRVGALLVKPRGGKKLPGVIWVHPAPGNRHTFLDEALDVAQRGAVCLLVDAPWSRGEAWGRTMGEPEHDLMEHLATAKDLCRAIDLLVTHAEVEAGRIAYVGHSLGALFGGILAGVEERVQTCILMAGVGSFADIAALNMPQLQGPALSHYREVLKPIEPLYYLQHAPPCPLLFQFGLLDRSFNRFKFIEFAAAGSEPKAVKWYNANHYLPDPAARRDRLEWLQAQLHLRPAPASEGGAREARAA